jgi:hypothetical protein
MNPARGEAKALECSVDFMATVNVTHLRQDTLDIEVGPDWGRALLALSVVLAWVLGGALGWPTGGAALLWLAAGALLDPVAAVIASRALRTRRYTLARAPGRLMFDGEPLDLARVELRLLEWPWVKRPRAYELSLWMLTSSGPVSLPLGRFSTMVKASGLSGDLEEFLQQAGIKQPRRV